MIWLDDKRGYLSDWLTQRWVQLTGRRVDLLSAPWLAGPGAPTRGIGPEYFSSVAREAGLQIGRPQGCPGILPDFTVLRGPGFDPASVHPEVIRFYQETSAYELDAWAEWSGLFHPFGWLLALLFSRRLQQLNVPLSPLDTSRGITSEVLPFLEPGTGAIRHTAWFRRLPGTGHVLYAGFYSTCVLPGWQDPCVKVVFPLPNGNAIVIMRTTCRPDGSFVVTSAGRRFGDPGFYFTVRSGPGAVWARYVRPLRESIRVFPAEDGCVRADHILTFCRLTFLRLHYRMRRWMAPVEQERAAGGGRFRAEGNGRSPAADLPLPPGREGSDG